MTMLSPSSGGRETSCSVGVEGADKGWCLTLAGWCWGAECVMTGLRDEFWKVLAAAAVTAEGLG